MTDSVEDFVVSDISEELMEAVRRLRYAKVQYDVAYDNRDDNYSAWQKEEPTLRQAVDRCEKCVLTLAERFTDTHNAEIDDPNEGSEK